ncbi:MAG: 2-amino-4-hydroxy-6-hydroxymethyldihydropteridine diphosphokinase [Planctomycetes bacterium]|nr:2-amino-4-hydroxy-6-hydroxymethyldihydropteridine diphosphokinase [Planctomycetota bacterium]
MTEVFIAVGSNIDPIENIPAAFDLLAEDAAILSSSTFYITKPIGRPEQDDYRNGVWKIETHIPPRALKYDTLRKIEAALGRVRIDDKYAARTIDLDIAVYGDKVVAEEGLVLPDPDIALRPFLAAPLLELAPEMILPSGEKLSEIVARMDLSSLAADAELTNILQQRIDG